MLGSLPQGEGPFAGDERLLDVFASESGLDSGSARTLLAKFSLGADDVHRRGRSLSPGERSRATLALLAARGVNALVLDEPTNHLDLEAITELESALAATTARSSSSPTIDDFATRSGRRGRSSSESG